MRKRKILAVGAVALTLGCGGGTDFWGNPVPSETVDDGSTCAVPAEPVPAPPYDPGSQNRPPDVKPGNSWILFELEVRALNTASNRDYCVPVAVHVYTRSGEADAVSLDNLGVPGRPYDVFTVTPWTGRFVALQYDPTEERFAGAPPRYEIHLDAKYQREKDTNNESAPVALGCAIKLRGATVASDVVAIAAGTTVRCELKSNDHWIHG